MRIENGRGWARQLVTDAGGGGAREPHVGRGEQSEDLALGATIAAIVTTGGPWGAQHVTSRLHRCGQMLLDLVHPEVLAGGRGDDRD